MSSQRRPVRLASLVLLLVAGCAGIKSGPSVTGGGGGGTTGSGSGGGSGSGSGGGPQKPPPDGASPTDATGICNRDLRAVVRDFKGQVTTAGEIKHPDFEYVVADDHAIVADTLGADSKPIYAPGDTGMTPTTHGKAYFDQWYNDVDGVNLRFEQTIALTPDPTRAGVYVYDNDLFFPIDDMGFGNQYQTHNFDFTTELHFNFPYHGGERFTFRGDDDLFLFVNGHKVVDLGGVHLSQQGIVDLDARAAELGLVIDGTYRMDIFHAERHVIESHFHIETTLSCVDNIIVP